MKEYRYGYSEIAGACGKSVGAVRVDVGRKVLRPDDLVSVAVYVVVNRLGREVNDERADKKIV